MCKFIQFLLIIIVLIVMMTLPKYVTVDDISFMEWQRKVWEWNYIGVLSNYILFVFYAIFSKAPMGAFGVQSGLWMRNKAWYATVTILVIGISKFMDYLSKGTLHFIIPTASTVIFQLLYVALGEELFWRGFIQTKFGFWFASLGFGVLHAGSSLISGLTLDYSLSYGLVTALLGMIFGLTRQKTDSVYASALLHGLYNLGNHLIT